MVVSAVAASSEAKAKALGRRSFFPPSPHAVGSRSIDFRYGDRDSGHSKIPSTSLPTFVFDMLNAKCCVVPSGPVGFRDRSFFLFRGM